MLLWLESNLIGFSERLKPDSVRGKPLCMAVHKYMFNTCREPRKIEDVTCSYVNEGHTHVAVLCGGQLWEIPTEGKNKQPLPVPVLQRMLEDIIRASEVKSTSSFQSTLRDGSKAGKAYIRREGGVLHGVGVMTADNRYVDRGSDYEQQRNALAPLLGIRGPRHSLYCCLHPKKTNTALTGLKLLPSLCVWTLRTQLHWARLVLLLPWRTLLFHTIPPVHFSVLSLAAAWLWRQPLVGQEYSNRRLAER